MTSRTSDLLTVRQVALRFGIGTRTVWRWVRTGRLPPPIRLPKVRQTRWRTADLDCWLRLLPRHSGPNPLPQTPVRPSQELDPVR